MRITTLSTVGLWWRRNVCLNREGYLGSSIWPLMVFRFGPRVNGSKGDRPGRQFKPFRCKVVNPRWRKNSNMLICIFLSWLFFFFLTNPLLRLWGASVSISSCGFVSLLLNSTSWERCVCELGVWTLLNASIFFPLFLSCSTAFRLFTPIPKTAPKWLCKQIK